MQPSNLPLARGEISLALLPDQNAFGVLKRTSDGIARSLTSASSLGSEPFGSHLKADLLGVEDSRVALEILTRMKRRLDKHSLCG